MSYTRRFDPDLVIYGDLDVAMDWLRANSVDPRDVPLDACVTLDRRNMTIDVYLTRDGQKFVTDGDIARSAITVPLVRRPPVLASLGPARRKR